jgi:hypothetical protein
MDVTGRTEADADAGVVLDPDATGCVPGGGEGEGELGETRLLALDALIAAARLFSYSVLTLPLSDDGPASAPRLGPAAAES